MPLILCSASYSLSQQRNQFLYTIFNLIERPGDEQSQVILMNYVAFAHDVGTTCVEAKLPQ